MKRQLKYKIENLARRIAIWLLLWLERDSNIVRHARKELELAGYCTVDEDMGFNAMVRADVIELCALFASQGHSGMSSGFISKLAQKCMMFEILTPLTGNDDEWYEPFVGEGLQNRRCGHVFKDETGAYDIEGRIFREPSGACYTNRDSRVYITFPYMPEREYVDVPGPASE